MMAYEQGDWLYFDRPNAVPEPARFLREAAKKVLIEVRFVEPYDRRKTQRSKEIWVSPGLIRPREFPADEFGDVPVKERAGFSLEAWNHPMGRATQVFRNTGLWYGRIDGIDATAPCHRADRAVLEAWLNLESGQFAAQLATKINTIENWFEADTCSPGGEVNARRDEIQHCLLLEKVLQAFPAHLPKTGFETVQVLQACRMAAQADLESLIEAHAGDRPRG